MKNSNLNNDPQYIAEELGLDYIGTTIIGDKKIYQFIEPTSNSSFSFYPYQLHISYIRDFMNKVKSEYKTSNIYRFTSMDYDYTKNQFFKYEIDGGGEESLDKQQAWDTDLSLPDTQRKEKENSGLDWTGRENLQAGFGSLKLGWTYTNEFEKFEKVLQTRNVDYYKEDNWLIIITSNNDVNLNSVSELPNRVFFKNRGNIYLDSLTTLPDQIEFNNAGDIYLGHLTELPLTQNFYNKGDVILSLLTTLPENANNLFKNNGYVYFNWDGGIGDFIGFFEPATSTSRLSFITFTSVEERVEFLKSKYQDLPPKQIEDIVNADPTPNKQNIIWLTRQVQNQSIRLPEDRDRVK